MLTFCKKLLASAKSRCSRYQNLYFLKLLMCVYVRTKFQISSVILTSFRRGIILPTPPHPYPPLKTPDQIKVNLKTITNKCSLSFKYNLFAHKSVSRWPTSRINILTIYYKLGQGFITNSGSFVLLQIGAA